MGNLERGAKVRIEQEVQLDWNRIQESKYCEDYGRWKTKLGREDYWEDRERSLAVKVQWARLRCGSIGRGMANGYTDETCRVCGRERETIWHIWVCERARENMREEWIREVEQRGLGDGAGLLGNRLGKIL